VAVRSPVMTHTLFVGLPGSIEAFWSVKLEMFDVREGDNRAL
jgi:hypothetical protein